MLQGDGQRLAAPPRFRTIQVCPKDLRGVLRQAILVSGVLRLPMAEPTARAAAAGVQSRLAREEPMFGVRRREFITLLGGAAAWPLGARAQQPKVWRIGFLAPAPPTRAMLNAFRDGLRERGYVEGQNLSIDVR